MTIGLCVQHETILALQDAWEIINQYGEDIIVCDREEANVTRDKYSSIKYRATTSTLRYAMKAYPIIFTPSRRQIEKAGLREECQCIITTATKSWTDISKTFEDIDMIRDTVILRRNKYLIKEKSNVNQYANTFLYINFGLNLL
jgi:hypothetical protein